MDKDYAPVRALYVDPESKKEFVTNFIHYGNSLVLGKIEELPLIQLLLGTVIVVIGYLSFSYLKRSEQSNIWVGMAKETAHQLGTPLSSLLGWCRKRNPSRNVTRPGFSIAPEENSGTNAWSYFANG